MPSPWLLSLINSLTYPYDCHHVLLVRPSFQIWFPLTSPLELYVTTTFALVMINLVRSTMGCAAVSCLEYLRANSQCFVAYFHWFMNTIISINVTMTTIIQCFVAYFHWPMNTIISINVIMTTIIVTSTIIITITFVTTTTQTPPPSSQWLILNVTFPQPRVT